MAQASRALVRAGVFADVVDVGGGFPSVYPGMVPPDLGDYVAAIDRGFAEMMVHETTELWCEPGRALVAEGSSLLTRVELRKGDALYLNDGAYGSLFDAAHAKWPFPGQAGPRRRRRRDAPLKPFRFYGPTCDSLDHMPGPFWLPDDVGEGDYVEIGMLGAYGVAMATRFNGFGELETRRSSRTRRWPRCSASRRARSRRRGPRPPRSSSCRARRGKKRRRRPLAPAATPDVRANDQPPNTKAELLVQDRSSTSTSPPTTRGR